MSDKELEVKAPQDAIDILPQERITGDILRGRGPRRGNLERLLKYWRPIMRKPGGFRRCIVILANHPELYPLQPLCAWLHHETTGLWPNEGNHHEGGKLGPVLRGFGAGARRRAVPGKRRRRRKKSEDGGLEIASWRLYRRLGGMSTRPLNGDQNAVEYKAARIAQGFKSVPIPGSFEWDEDYAKNVEVDTVEDLLDAKVGLVNTHGRLGRSLQSLASFFIPGDMGKYRSPVRSAIYGSLTPGGGGLGPGIGGGGAGRPSIGGRALRCPQGYLNGGRFTDPKLSNCGGVIYDTPAKGPGAITAADRGKMTRRFQGSQPEDLEDVARDVIVKKPKGDPFAVVREAAMKPNSRPNIKRRESSVKDVTSYASENRNTTRIVRRDGVVFEPRVGADELVRMKDHDNLKDAVYVTSKIGKKGIAGDEMRLLTKGAKSVQYVFPEGNVRVSRKGNIGSNTAAKIRTRWAALSRDPDVKINPFVSVENLAREFPTHIQIETDFNKIKNANERVVVFSAAGERRVVPRWVFSLYLSERAPRRPSGRKPFSLVPQKGEEKVLSTDRVERAEYASLLIEYKSLGFRESPLRKKSVSDIRISNTYGLSKDSIIDVKAAKFVLASEDPEMAVKIVRRAITPGGRRRGRGGRVGGMARRVPKVAPYNPDARDADNDALVQEGTIWERPNGTVFRGLARGARQLTAGVALVDGDGRRVDYKPGDGEASPLRRLDRAVGAGRLRQRNIAEGAEADFDSIDRRANLRRVRMRRAIQRVQQSPDRRERRAERLRERADRDEERGQADLDRAEALRQFRIERDALDARHREERDELEARNPRREQRQQRRDERLERLDQRIGQGRQERRDREEGMATFGDNARERRRAERRQRRDERLDRLDRAVGQQRQERRDREEGARAEFGDTARRQERRNEERNRSVDLNDRIKEDFAEKGRANIEQQEKNRADNDIAPEEQRVEELIVGSGDPEMMEVLQRALGEGDAKERANVVEAIVRERLGDERWERIKEKFAEDRDAGRNAENGLVPVMEAVFGSDEKRRAADVDAQGIYDNPNGAVQLLAGDDLWGENGIDIPEDASRTNIFDAVEARIDAGEVDDPALLDARLDVVINDAVGALAVLDNPDRDPAIRDMNLQINLGMQPDNPDRLNAAVASALHNRIHSRARMRIAEQRDTAQSLKERLRREDRLNVIENPVPDIPEPEIPEADLPALEDLRRERFEAPAFRQRFGNVEAEWGRRGRQPSLDMESRGIDADMAQRIRNNDMTEADKRKIRKLAQDALSLGPDNAFVGRDPNMEFRIVREDGSAPRLTIRNTNRRVSISMDGGSQNSTGSRIQYRRRDADGNWSDWNYDNRGSSSRRITLTPREDGTWKVSQSNATMYVDPGSAGVKNAGFAGFYNHNAYLHWHALGDLEVNVSAASDGKVVWGMQGFDDQNAARKMVDALVPELAAFRTDGPSDGNIIRDAIMADQVEELIRRRDAGERVTLAMGHGILSRKDAGKHPWQRQKLDGSDIPDSEKGKGISESRYGQWFLQNAAFGSGALRNDDEFGDELDRITRRILGERSEDVTPDVTPDEMPEPVDAFIQPLRGGIDRRPGGFRKVNPDAPNHRGIVGDVDNPDIQDSRAAFEHLRDGGDLAEIPAALRRDALQAASTTDEVDGDSLFFRLEGGSGITQPVLFFRRGEDGRVPEVNGERVADGYILKKADFGLENMAASPANNGLRRFGVDQQQSQVNEAFGIQLADQLGFANGGMARNGELNGEPIMIAELANAVADAPGVQNLKEFQRDPDRAVSLRTPEMTDQRLESVVLSYMLGSIDQHDQNIMILTDEDGMASGILPIDFGRIGVPEGMATNQPEIAPRDFLAFLERSHAESETNRLGADNMNLLRDIRNQVSDGVRDRESTRSVIESFVNRTIEILDQDEGNMGASIADDLYGTGFDRARIIAQGDGLGAYVRDRAGELLNQLDALADALATI